MSDSTVQYGIGHELYAFLCMVKPMINSKEIKTLLPLERIVAPNHLESLNVGFQDASIICLQRGSHLILFSFFVAVFAQTDME